ncbi:uncharacterized protein [Temnothorax nylanderi]|uniref:uncharacterized protein n=1 Tax=Temnothorax nylanderi TaxID=102681 RepID=UPI003A89B176
MKSKTIFSRTAFQKKDQQKTFYVTLQPKVILPSAAKTSLTSSMTSRRTSLSASEADAVSTADPIKTKAQVKQLAKETPEVLIRPPTPGPLSPTSDPLANSDADITMPMDDSPDDEVPLDDIIQSSQERRLAMQNPRQARFPEKMPGARGKGAACSKTETQQSPGKEVRGNAAEPGTHVHRVGVVGGASAPKGDFFPRSGVSGSTLEDLGHTPIGSASASAHQRDTRTTSSGSWYGNLFRGISEEVRVGRRQRPTRRNVPGRLLQEVNPENSSGASPRRCAQVGVSGRRVETSPGDFSRKSTRKSAREHSREGAHRSASAADTRKSTRTSSTGNRPGIFTRATSEAVRTGRRRRRCINVKGENLVQRCREERSST